MTKRLIAALLLMAMLLTGCGAPATEETVPDTTAAPETVVTAPPLKSYTGEVNDDVVATIGEAMLTNRELQAWYWAEVAQYRQENHETAPDFDRPLDSQPCGIDDAAETWQEYFLWEAVDAWHTAQALMMQSREVPMPLEEAYQPYENLHEMYLQEMPVTKYLYGYNKYYQLNTLHEKYLNALPEMLAALAKRKGYADAADMAERAFGTTEAMLNAYVDLYNQGYMYFTAMSYYIQKDTDKEPVDAQLPEEYVNIRHILLKPEGSGETAWTDCEEAAQALLENLESSKRDPEYVFAELAVKYSQDTGTALDGGAYYNLHRGQLMDILDVWCFDSERKPGDTVILRTECGVSVLYFAGWQDQEALEEEKENTRTQFAAIIEEAKLAHPMEVDYGLVRLGEADGTVAAGDILYPDIAHERFPEVPLYLQKDYPGVSYGDFTLKGNGCGITTLAMLASYMADDELTPPEMCERFGMYSHLNGTDGFIFENESSGLGFYLRERTYNFLEARAALEEGQIVVSVQYPGYWTKVGHYLVLLRVTEDDRVQVRDSNIHNYGRLEHHKEDLHPWLMIIRTAGAFWIFEDKVTLIPACSRCGTEEAITDILLTEDYVCHKCRTALLRRDAYLGS